MTKKLLGVDVGGTKTAVIYAQETAGKIKIVDKVAFKTTNVWETIDTIISTIEIVLKRNGIEASDCAGIGISCGGPLDSVRGVVMSPPNLPDWQDIHIVKILSDKFGIPCAIQNDANACALAEYKYGAGVGTKNMAFLTFGTGLGAGLVINGDLYSGTNDNAGEVGHIRLSEFGPVGYGKAGSFEGFASGGGLAQIARMKLDEKKMQGISIDWCPVDKISEVTAKDVAMAAATGDPLALEIIEISATYLGRGLAIMIDILNPECIVIGSIYARNEHLFKPIVEKVLAKEALGVACKVCRIVPAKLGENIGDYAAISIASNIK